MHTGATNCRLMPYYNSRVKCNFVGTVFVEGKDEIPSHFNQALEDIKSNRIDIKVLHAELCFYSSVYCADLPRAQDQRLVVLF